MQEGGGVDEYPDTAHARVWAWRGTANDAVPDGV